MPPVKTKTKVDYLDAGEAGKKAHEYLAVANAPANSPEGRWRYW